MIDSTYRWGFVLVLAVVLTTIFCSDVNRKRSAQTIAKYGIGGGLVLVVAALVFALAFGESLLDALLLRAQFGFLVPDSGIHGYGWGLVFGYALALASAATFVIKLILGRRD
jgi:hypothetical protein